MLTAVAFDDTSCMVACILEGKRAELTEVEQSRHSLLRHPNCQLLCCLHGYAACRLQCKDRGLTRLLRILAGRGSLLTRPGLSLLLGLLPGLFIEDVRT